MVENEPAGTSDVFLENAYQSANGFCGSYVEWNLRLQNRLGKEKENKIAKEFFGCVHRNKNLGVESRDVLEILNAKEVR